LLTYSKSTPSGNMAKRMYVSDWAAEKIQQLSREEDIPLYMVVDKALKHYLNHREGKEKC